MRRYIITGTPGAGKTSIVRGLARLGHRVVEEAATDIIACRQLHGETQPWTGAAFIDEIVTVQRERQRATDAATDDVVVFDRSPVCTHALARHLGQPISATLSSELDRINTEHVYESAVIFIRNLGFCEPTAARRISYQDALKFERIHQHSYRAFGYQIIDIPADSLNARIQAVHQEIARLDKVNTTTRGVATIGAGKIGQHAAQVDWMPGRSADRSYSLTRS
ncbi:hypothetical protein MB901379_03320 [Mycobacterium basiliense]|uniref:NadR/Ttd14 AAA domain-containing protein n=1 Tax=Mycobacterium basiliense TaxID=2094119 RepID=A0A447GH84_9MYCO|nr:AAA family ATPase [Mycobacterium basiliense]VDM89739.1 hypothetical protein MB901379_03320 [Mycobacterium basiliense]